jgi:hypothetical protein
MNVQNGFMLWALIFYAADKLLVIRYDPIVTVESAVIGETNVFSSYSTNITFEICAVFFCDIFNFVQIKDVRRVKIWYNNI